MTDACFRSKLGQAGEKCGLDAMRLLGYFVVLAAVAAVILWLSGWNPFLPKDYEDCIESAAKSARSKEAVEILVSSCGIKFVGRRDGRGGYSYYDERQSRNFGIAGPNPTPQEWKSIDAEYSIYLRDQREDEKRQAEEQRRAAVAQAEIEDKRRQAQLAFEKRQQQIATELEGRRRAAVSKVRVVSSSIECRYGPTTCGVYKITVEVKNYSSENIAAISFGWAFVPLGDAGCPNTVPTKIQETVMLRPGENAVLNIDGYDGPGSTPVHYCIKVADAQIGP